MSSQTNEISHKRVYSLDCVEKMDPPDGAEGDNWYRYVIARSASTIVGYRRGTLNQVTEHAEAYVDELNARASGKSSPHWAAPRRQQKS